MPVVDIVNLQSFRISNPRKGTETLDDQPKLTANEGFRISNPRKGTETKIQY